MVTSKKLRYKVTLRVFDVTFQDTTRKSTKSTQSFRKPVFYSVLGETVYTFDYLVSFVQLRVDRPPQ